jgi:hypothetical protein
VTVEFTAAGHRALAPNIQRGQRVELSGIGLARDHPILLLHCRIGGGQLHAAVFNGWPLIFVEIGQYRRGLDRLCREPQRLHRAHSSGRLMDWRAVLGDQNARDPVIGPRALDIVANDSDTGGLPILDRLLQLVDRRFFETKRLCICHEHKLASS